MDHRNAEFISVWKEYVSVRPEALKQFIQNNGQNKLNSEYPSTPIDEHVVKFP